MEVQQKQQHLIAQQQAQSEKMLQEGRARIAAEIPNWGDSVKQELAKTALDYGYSKEEISGLSDPRAVKLLHDAMQWRKSQQNQSIVDKKVASAPPVVKPGAKDTKTVASAKVKADREALRKTGKADYAARLIERTL